MGRRVAIFVLGCFMLAGEIPAHADSAPAFVIPGKPGVPVIIDNFDASWAYVEGDWGLSRPGHVPQTVIGGRYVGPKTDRMKRTRFFPTAGNSPPQGRQEIEPPSDRQPPPPPENFFRSWSTSTEPVPPADLPQSNSETMPVMPPVIVAPQFGPRRHSP